MQRARRVAWRSADLARCLPLQSPAFPFVRHSLAHGSKRHTMMKSLWRAAICALLLGAAEGNMNGKPGQYKIANGNPASPKAYSTDYNAEYFDVYGPTIKTRYSEVYWKMQEAVPIPEAIRKRFHNKTMAIVGYEVDQVQVPPLLPTLLRKAPRRLHEMALSVTGSPN